MTNSPPSFVPHLPLVSNSTRSRSSFLASKCPLRKPSPVPNLQTVMTCAPLSPRQHDDKPKSPSHFPVNNSPTQIAHLELGAGNPSAAIPHLEAHLADYPDDSRAWLKLGKAVKSSSGLSNAIKVMRRAVSEIPTNPFLWHYYAELVSQCSGAHQARQTLRLAVEQCPPSPVLYCAAAVAEASVKNCSTATQLFEAAVQADPTDAITYLKWTSFLRQIGKYEKARSVYREAIKHIPAKSRPVMYTAFAGMEARGRRYDAARGLFQLAAESNPNDRMVWQPWACMEERAGDVERARALFERAVLVDPKFTSSWQSWGLLEQRLGNFDAARCLFERGTLADPSDPTCWEAWGLLEAEAGNSIEARRLFAEGASRVKDSSSAAPLFIAWGRLEESLGEIDLARLRFSAALKRKHEKLSDKVILTHTLAGLEFRAGNLDSARGLYSKVLRMNRREYRSLYAWAMMEMDAFCIDAAYKLLKRSVRIAPRDPRSVQALASIECDQYLRTGGLERARSLLRRAIGHSQPNEQMIQFWMSLERQYGDPKVATNFLSNARTR